VLNLDKPAGITSRQALDVLKRLARPAKTGHAGTLDPLANGVLVACVGSATRLVEYVQRMPKAYRATFLLGRASPTDDIEGDVAELPDPPRPTRGDIQAAAARLVGRIEQRPPAFSALRLAGRRAYDLARRGDSVALAARPVEVYRIAVAEYEYPELVLDVECGSGTYIRALGRDLAKSLDTAAVMSALTRTAIGSFQLADAVAPRRLTAENWRVFLQPALRAVDYLPRVTLSAPEATRIRNGLAIERAESGKRKAESEEQKPEGGEFGRVRHGRESSPPDSFSRVRHGRDPAQEQPQEFAALDETGRLVAILIPHGPNELRPLRNLAPGN
jgi:tRNA pseudouridine55 synthase